MYMHLLVLAAAASLAAAAVPLSAPYYHRHPGRLNHLAFPSPVHQRHALRLTASAERQLANSCNNEFQHTVSPADYGADPGGLQDSTHALRSAVEALLRLGTQKDAQGRVDLGGARLDLGGGAYSVSGEIVLPPGYANFGISGGSLVARANFSGSYLLRIGGGACNSTSGGHKNCMSGVDIQELTLDAGNIAFGGMLVQDSMNVNVGPAVMVVGFSGVGISLEGSGAGFVHECWLGQFSPGTQTARSAATATAILLPGSEHDCDVNNVIVFSGLVGVNSTNGANRLQGVHVWNLKGSAGGTGIRLHGGSGRVQQAYLASSTGRGKARSRPPRVRDDALPCLHAGLRSARCRRALHGAARTEPRNGGGLPISRLLYAGARGRNAERRGVWTHRDGERVPLLERRKPHLCAGREPGQVCGRTQHRCGAERGGQGGGRGG